MNGRTQLTLISLVCVMVVTVSLWYITSHMHIPAEEKQPPLFKTLPQYTDKVKRIHSLSKTPFYVADEEEISSLPKSRPYIADKEKMDEHEDKDKTEFLPKTLPFAADEEEKIPSLSKTLPYAKELKNIHDIQRAKWTSHLYQFLQSLNKSISPQVNMVFGDSDHMELVLNWIIAALVRLDPPLHNIMVLSLDQSLCDLLASKKVPVACIAVPPESILASPGPKSWAQGVASRFLVLRIINFWGYDVASYDSDAVLLRNLQSHSEIPSLWEFWSCEQFLQTYGGSCTSPSSYIRRQSPTQEGCTLVVFRRITSADTRVQQILNAAKATYMNKSRTTTP